MVTSVNETTFDLNIDGLELWSNYSVWIAAQTEAGIGVQSQIWTVMTGAFVNGNWTEWTSWGTCDVSCGLGYIRRERWCTNPEPLHGGEDCEGVDEETISCNNFTCPAYYLSEPAVDCERTCKKVNDTYGCLTVIDTRDSKDIIENARDPVELTKSANLTCVVNDANSLYAEEYHPSYDVTANECQGFIGVPEKIICTTSTFIDPNIRRLCRCVDPESLGYEEWAIWSPCTKSCGKGIKRRFRNCLMEVGCGRTMDEVDCNVFQCPVNGQWSSWSRMTPCTKTCGFGSTQRTRTCTAPAPRHGGRDCVGTPIEIIEGCNPYPCPVNGGFGDWIQSDYCTQPCGLGGVIPFRRFCDNPKPKYRGGGCQGSNYRTIPCNEHIRCNESISVTFISKLLDLDWYYTMVYKDHHHFIDVRDQLTDAIMTVMNASSVGSANVEAIHLNQLSRGSVISNFSIVYHRVPFTEVLVLQEAIDKIGRIDTLNTTFINVTSNDVPNEPPKFTAVSNTPYSIDINWNRVSNHSINGGGLYLYYIYYRSLKGDDRSWKVYGTKNLTARLDHLIPGNLYGIRMMVSAPGANGIASLEQEIWTIEGVPYIEPPNSTYDEIDHETTYLSWGEITQEYVPGTLVGYHIKVRKYHETQFVVHSTVSKLMTITGLKADTFYWVEITGYTIAGDGPEAVVVFKTPRGPPGAPPPNVTCQDMYSTSAINITWDAIPEDQENGYLVGYTIKYRLIRQSGKDLPKDDSEVTVVFDRFVFAHEITDLVPYGIYQVDIYGYALEGDGPIATIFGETCACPPFIYTNFLVQPPYVVMEGRGSNTTLSGLFPHFLEMIINGVCNRCRSYPTSILVYNQTLTGHPSKKVRINDMKNQIEGSHLTFPLYGNFEIENFQGVYPYVGIVHSQGVAMIVVKETVKTLGFVSILTSISNAWSVMLVALLISSVIGWSFWFAEQPSEESEIRRDRSIIGCLQGLWIAYVTMTTVGYGDFVPTTKLSQLLMMFWTLAGLVIMGLVTGVIASGLTINDIDEVIKLYGTDTAVIQGSYENGLAIRRNAKIDESRNYTEPLEVLQAVQEKVVKIGLIDATIATSYTEDINRLGLFVHKVIDMKSGHGVAISGGLEVIRDDVKSYVMSKMPFINEFVRRKVPLLYPEKFEVESEIISEAEVVNIMVVMGYAFAFLFIVGIGLWIYRNRKVKLKIEPVTSLTIFPPFNNLVSGFVENVTEKIEKLTEDQENQIVELDEIRRKYTRLVRRIGYRKGTAQNVFEIERKKTVRKLKMKKYDDKLKIYMMENND
ncbi:uncharacterized protein [Clytia hemisphaerica]|uniref:uncharacterized protein n=1 Tax=Clytia hemisphaerica TaxID=252671 RepID=UPI0034D6E279